MSDSRVICLVVFILALAAGQGALADDSRHEKPAHYTLPDLGTPSDQVLPPQKEAEYGRQVLYSLREHGLLVADPVVKDYIYHLGFRLVANSDKPQQPFHFSVIRDPRINAFAVPGGYIFIHSGLFLMSENESELAGVVSHEIAHITQRHSSRTLANMSKVSVPILLGMAGALIAAKGSGDASQAIIASGMGLQQQMAINFTRAHEHEADRLGINILAKSRLDPEGLASFFDKMLRKYRVTDERYELPEYLRTHPLSVTRISEAKNRAEKLQVERVDESALYSFVKERLRVLDARKIDDALVYYQKQPMDNTAAWLYGYAFALVMSSRPQEALRVIASIPRQAETRLWIDSLEAEALSYLDMKKSNDLFGKLAEEHDYHPIVAVPWINALIRHGEKKNVDMARDLVKKLTVRWPDDPDYFALLAVVNENAGRVVEATEAKAHEHHLSGRNYQAVRILRNLLREDLDYYQRARITARIRQYERLITARERQQERARGRHVSG